MPSRLVKPTLNWVLGLAAAAFQDGSGGALGSAAGFPRENLGNGRLDKPWKRNAAAAGFYIAIDLGAARTVTQIAVLDAYATNGLQEIGWTYGTDMSTWAPAEVELLLASARFNGSSDYAVFPTSVSKRYIRLHVVPNNAADVVRIGQIVIAQYTELGMGPAQVRPMAAANVRVNGSQATKHGEERFAAQLRWGRMLSADHQELLDLHRSSLQGSLKPFLLTPDSTAPSEVYFGRVGNAFGWEQSSPMYRGHGFDFQELERPLRG